MVVVVPGGVRVVDISEKKAEVVSAFRGNSFHFTYHHGFRTYRYSVNECFPF